MAQEYFDTWCPSANQFLIQGREAAGRRWNNKAAFELHQATERLYHCVVLVLTSYTPQRHNIAFLRSLAVKLDIRLVDVWPGDDRCARSLFTLLRDAYVKARYSKHYSITIDELDWLANWIEELSSIVHTVCSKKISELRQTAGVIELG